MRVEQPSMVTDGGHHDLHVAEIEKVDFLQIEKTTRGTKFNPKTFIYSQGDTLLQDLPEVANALLDVRFRGTE